MAILALCSCMSTQPLESVKAFYKGIDLTERRSGPDCKDAPICILSRSHPDLLTLEGNPCPNAMAFGVGYGVESVLCEDGN